MAHLVVEIKENIIWIKSQAFCAQFQDHDENQKALFVFLRSLSCPETGKALFTNQQVADAFGKNDRVILTISCAYFGTAVGIF